MIVINKAYFWNALKIIYLKIYLGMTLWDFFKQRNKMIFSKAYVIIILSYLNGKIFIKKMVKTKLF
jgi:hypothetical protein